MTDLPTLMADLEKLKSARRSGVLKVRFTDREVTYRTDEELARQIAALEQEISGTRPGPLGRMITVRSTKGW